LLPALSLVGKVAPPSDSHLLSVKFPAFSLVLLLLPMLP
jgi:hypothetical protein